MEEGEVAQSRRRGKDAVDDHLGEVFDDAVDDNATDFDDDTDLDEDLIDQDELGGPTRRRTTSSSRTLSRAATRSSAASRSRARSGQAARPGPLAHLSRFIREVVAELKKVIRPTRKELVTYTSVVLVFVTIMLTIVGVLDYVFAWLVLHVFGGGK